MNYRTIIGIELKEGDSQKTGKPYSGYLVHTVGTDDYPGSKLIGQSADTTFVDRELFEAALKGKPIDDSLIGIGLLFLYPKGSTFVSQVIVQK